MKSVRVPVLSKPFRQQQLSLSVFSCYLCYLIHICLSTNALSGNTFSIFGVTKVLPKVLPVLFGFFVVRFEKSKAHLQYSSIFSS